MLRVCCRLSGFTPLVTVEIRLAMLLATLVVLVFFLQITTSKINLLCSEKKETEFGMCIDENDFFFKNRKTKFNIFF